MSQLAPQSCYVRVCSKSKSTNKRKVICGSSKHLLLQVCYYVANFYNSKFSIVVPKLFSKYVLLNYMYVSCSLLKLFSWLPTFFKNFCNKRKIVSNKYLFCGVLNSIIFCIRQCSTIENLLVFSNNLSRVPLMKPN